MKYSNDVFQKLLTHEETVLKYSEPDMALSNLPTIKEFYAGKEIFITGGSGFIGKVLIEKLLRSCSDVKVIYVLLRSKKGKTVEERLKEIVENCLFDVIRIVNPDFIKKLIPISGDVAKLGLGLSDEDRDRMKNVSIVFHSAASVRFDDSLKHSVLINTRGTRELLRFAESLCKLNVVMHVSTIFCNVLIQTVEEKVYPPIADWRKTIEICEKLDDEDLNNVTQHYMSFVPTTYVFSKNLAEQITNEYKGKLPIVLFRPSMVTNCAKEPLPGWTDNIYGPLGILLLSALGICQTAYSDPKNVLDMCPVDLVCKAMIIAGWKRAHEPIEEFPIFNCAAGSKFKITIEQVFDMCIHHGLFQEFPMEHNLMRVGSKATLITLIKPLHYVRLMCYQIIPSALIDFALKLQKKKPILMNIQRKLFDACITFSYFTTRNWDFKNDNSINLCSFLKLEDYKDFDCSNYFLYDITWLLRCTILGQRRYFLKEKDESLPRCRKRFLLQERLNTLIKSIAALVLIYYIFFKFNLIENIKEYLNF